MKREIRNKLLMLLDILLISISVYSAYLLRFSDGGFGYIDPRFISTIPHVIIVAVIIKVIWFSIFKLYSSLWEYAGIHEVFYIVIAVFISNSFMQAYIFVVDLDVPRSIFLITILTDIFLIAGARFAYRIFRRIKMGEMIRFTNAKKVLVVGGGDTGASVIRELKRHPEMKSLPVAIIDNDPMKSGKNINGVPIVGNDESISDVLEKYEIDEVIA